MKTLFLWRRTFSEIFHKEPRILVINFLFSIWNGVKAYPNILLSTYLIEHLIVRDFKYLFFISIILLLYNLISGMITGILTNRQTLANNRFSSLQRESLARFAAESSYEKLINSNAQDKINLIYEFTSKYGISLKSVSESLFSIIENLVSLIAGAISLSILFFNSRNSFFDTKIIAIMISILFAVLILDLIALVSHRYVQNKMLETKYDLLGLYRVWNYLDREYLLFNKSGKDVRIFQQHYIIKELLHTANQTIVQTNKKQQKRFFMWNLLWNLKDIICNFFFLLGTGILVIYNYISVGHFTGIVNATQKCNRNILNFFAQFDNCSRITEWLFLYWDYCDYMTNDCNRTSLQKVNETDKSNTFISIDHLSYQYSGSDRYALKNICLNIKKGEHIAIVGRNGSGKTTLILQLCGLLEAQKGNIRMDDLELWDVSKREIYSKISAMFQDFHLISLPLGENVAVCEDYDKERVLQSLHKAGLQDSFDSKLETYLFKRYEESGIDISGGEQQKVALARTIYKDSEIVILDEPTSALDPISEFHLFEEMNQAFADKTVIFISHRLSSCRFCDRIFVLDQGELVQSGTHEQLLNDLNGIYATLWEAQAQYYRM